MKNEVLDTYHNLRQMGFSELDIEKVTGVHRQYFHKLRKQNGSSDYELMVSIESHSFFEGY